MEPSEHSTGTFIERSGKVLSYGGGCKKARFTIDFDPLHCHLRIERLSMNTIFL